MTGSHDTQLVQPRPPVQVDAPPPPIVIPPPSRTADRTPRERRRRRRWIALAIVLLVGALSVFGGIAATRYYQRWNSHVPNLVGRSLDDATAQLRSEHYGIGQITKRFSETVPRNVVISTDPGSGARLEQGHRIDLVVSLGQDRVQVPNVVRQPLQQAFAMFQARGVQFSTSPDYRASWTVPKGDVISVNPPAGTAIPRSQVVHLIVSNGKPTATVPSIPQGMPFDDAKKTLTDAHFKVAERLEYNEDGVPAGDVVSTSPSGVQVVGTSITVVVSKGSAYVTMPDIPLLTKFADAKAQLEQLGLVVVKQAAVGDGKNGQVVGQDPPGGTRVHIGASVTLFVV
jgi:serine/threonine-protein kinase